MQKSDLWLEQIRIGEGYTKGSNYSYKVLLQKIKYEKKVTYQDLIKLVVGTKVCYLLQLSECLDHFY